MQYQVINPVDGSPISIADKQAAAKAAVELGQHWFWEMDSDDPFFASVAAVWSLESGIWVRRMPDDLQCTCGKCGT